MDDFSSELFNSFFDDHILERPLLADRPSLLHMDMDMDMDMDSSPGQFCRPLRMYQLMFLPVTYLLDVRCNN